MATLLLIGGEKQVGAGDWIREDLGWLASTLVKERTLCNIFYYIGSFKSFEKN